MKEKHILPQHINGDHRAGGSFGEKVLWWFEVVWWVLCSVHWSHHHTGGSANSSRWNQSGEERGAVSKQSEKNKPFFLSVMQNIYCTELSGLWSYQPKSPQRWSEESVIKRKKLNWKKRCATTRFTHHCFLALLFRLTYFKTCISKIKHSQSQAFNIDHDSM